MKLILEASELSEYLSKMSDWYNEMTMFVLTNMASSDLLARFPGPVPQEFHRLCKKFQEDHPKPSWKDLLPD